MNPENLEKHIPSTVCASLEARLAPFPHAADEATDERDLEGSGAAPRDRRYRLTLLNDLKLLFASLGAGNAVVPLGDNSRAARLLAEYAKSLRTQ
jgi:hypothetical protein